MGEREGYTTWEFPIKKALKIFTIIFLAGFTSSYILTRIVAFDYLLWNFHLQNLWLVIPETVIVVGSLWIWSWSRSSQRKKHAKKAKATLNKLLEEAGRG